MIQNQRWAGREAWEYKGTEKWRITVLKPYVPPPTVSHYGKLQKPVVLVILIRCVSVYWETYSFDR